MLFLLPVVFLLFWPGSESPFLLTKALALYACLAIGWVALSLAVHRGHSLRLPPRSVLLPMALLVLYALFRFPWFAPFYPHIRFPFLWDALPLVVLLVMNGARDARSLRLLTAVMGMVGAVVAVYGLLQYLGVDLSWYKGPGAVAQHSFAVGRGASPFATFGNPNFLAEFLAGLLPLMVARFLTEEGQRSSLLWGAGICFMVGTLLLTTTRSAWIGLVAGLVVLGWAFGLRGLPWRRIGGLTVAFSLTVFLLVIPLQGSGALQIAWQKGVRAFGFTQGSVGGRLLWWRVTARMIQERPVLGVGTGQFSSAYPAFQRRFGGGTAEGSSLISYTRGDLIVESPHNQLLHTAAELGLPGVVLLLWLVLILIQLGFRGRRSPKADGRIQVGAAAGLLSLMVHGLFAYPLQTAPGVLLFSLLAGLILACGNVVSPGPTWSEAGGEPPPGRRRDVVVTAVLTAIAIIHFGLLIPVYTSSLLLHRGTEFLLRREPDQAVVILEGAARVNPRDPQVRVVLGKAYAALGRFQEAAAAAEAGKRGIDSPELRRFLAGLYVDLGMLDMAEAEYREGMATWLGYAPLHAGYGALLARQGRYKAALLALQRAKELDPAFADTYHYLGHVYGKLGHRQEAIFALREYLERASPDAAWRKMDHGLIRSLKAVGVEGVR